MANPFLLPVPDFDDDEKALSALELSWADWQRGLRTGFRVRVSPDGNVTYKMPADKVVALLEVNKLDFESGDRSALITALRTVCQEHVPMPYWLSDGIISALAELDKNPDTSLHHVFEMDRIYPYATTRDKKRGRKARSDFKIKLDLYGRASLLIHIDKMRKTAAIRKAIEGLPIKFRTAFDWYNEMDSRQQRYLRALRGERLHKLR